MLAPELPAPAVPAACVVAGGGAGCRRQSGLGPGGLRGGISGCAGVMAALLALLSSAAKSPRLRGLHTPTRRWEGALFEHCLHRVQQSRHAWRFGQPLAAACNSCSCNVQDTRCPRLLLRSLLVAEAYALHNTTTVDCCSSGQ